MQRPFKKLTKKKQKNTGGKTSPHSEKDHGDQQDEELSAFEKAMAGVMPLDQKGRQVNRQPARRRPGSTDPDKQVRETLRRIVRGEVEFDLEATREYMQGTVRGLDGRVFEKLRTGRFSIEAHLDLHGMNLDQAKPALMEFLRRNYLEGKRCVLVIPGRGRNSPMGMGILRQEVRTWLTHEPLKRVVLAFCTALPRHGGAGALYVLLRRFKKGQGKIQWDRIFLDLDDTP
jgi:DNA-nicking Smr family endonuclease